MLYAFYHRHRLSAAWLALLATLMIYLAPPISRYLQAQHSLPTAEHRDHHSHDSDISTLDHASHDACGYCTLLGQLLWLTLSVPLLAATAALLRFRVPRLSFIPFRRPRPPFLARAPPHH